MIPLKIGFIGFGKMGQAIFKGLAYNKNFSSVCYYTDPNVKESIEGITKTDLNNLLEKVNIVLMCIKPQTAESLLTVLQQQKGTLKNKLWISILAGIPISTFEKYLGTHISIARVMPNTPALLRKGMTAIAFNKNVVTQDQELTQELFSTIGRTMLVDESQMDAVTGISGSGPAFMYKIADIIASTGKENGLSYEESLELISQTFIGAGEMLLSSGKTPQALIDDVSSPNGTTVAGLETLNKSTINKNLKDVIESAIKRSKELAK